MNIQNVLPAFGGIFSKSQAPLAAISNDLHQIVQTQNISIYVSSFQERIEKNNLFISKEGLFLWGGGTSLPNANNISLYDPLKNDEKFLFLKYSSSGISVYTDHYGKIPLFYILLKNQLYFGSSFSLLLKLLPSDWKKEININGLLFYYNYGFCSYENFIIKDVKILSGGKQINFGLNGFFINSYFTFQNFGGLQSFSDLPTNIKAIENALLKATDTKNKGYNKIGIALSGGVDSGYLAQKVIESGSSLNAYTIGFRGGYNEFERVDYLGEKLGFETKKILLSPEEIVDNYLKVSKTSSIPLGFNNSILNFIYKNAKEDGVDILYDGDGADRLFLGMNKYLELKKVLQVYNFSKKLKLNKSISKFLSLNILNNESIKKLHHYYEHFNNGFPFYGERKLKGLERYDYEYEKLLNDLAIPSDLENIKDKVEPWTFFTLFSLYYTPSFFFHSPYELQLQNNIVSNPHFWSDELVELALRIPSNQKLVRGTTKHVLRESAKLKIPAKYWDLPKIGLQNSFSFVKNSQVGKKFISELEEEIKESNEYQILQDIIPEQSIDIEKLIPYQVWKKNIYD